MSRADGGPADVEAQALALAEDALDRHPAERETFVSDQAGGNAALRERALSLLSRVEEIDGSIMTAGGVVAFDDLATPARIGSYRIEREIGRGGMGTVYLGSRDEGDFDHTAAIKVVRVATKGGRLAERLRSERQLLAKLKHPNIAQLHDGGETADGAPYFVMEFVDGAPLHRHLEERAPDLGQRLGIFREVCEAVAYAHRNLVIHRDLSPANILVSKDGVAKVIDFGVSLTIGDAADEIGPRFTLTKGYAAPERRRGEPATTLSDVYALGVILKDLLAGVPAPRRTDLDAIVARATAERPEDRYQGVAALVDDIERYLAARSVAARGRSWRYATRRFIGRRKLAVAAAAAALVGLFGASIVTTILYVRAQQAEAQAVRRFNEVRELANFMLFDLHDEIADVPGTTVARRSLADTSRRYLDALSATAGASDALRLETAIGYKRLADVLGVPIGANLGRREEAAEMLATSLEQIRALKAAAPDDPDVLRAYASASFSQAVFNFIALDNSNAALASAMEAEAAYRLLADKGAATMTDRIRLAESLIAGGDALAWLNRGEEAILKIEQGLAMLDALLAEAPNDAALLRARAEAAADLGDARSRQADFDFTATGKADYAPALADLDDGVARYAALLAEHPDDWEAVRGLSTSLWKRSRIHYSMENDEAALLDLAEAERLNERIIARDPEDLGVLRFRLILLSQRSRSLGYLGRHEDAAAVAREGIAGRRRLAEREPDNMGFVKDVADAVAGLSDVRQLAGDWPGACVAAQEAATLIEQIMSKGDLEAYSKEQFGALSTTTLEECRKRGLIASVAGVQAK